MTLSNWLGVCSAEKKQNPFDDTEYGSHYAREMIVWGVF